MTVVLSSAELTLRAWAAADATALAALADDAELRRWTSHRVADEDDAVRWIAAQQAGWATRERLSFAVLAHGQVAGHAVLKRPGGTGAVGEIGYWTGAPARGLGLASRAVELLTAWAFDADQGQGLTRLELFHNVGNPASCRVAEKAGFALEAVLPPRPPHPLDGHLHVCERGTVPEC
ncbi:GNAT family protein [Streptomyces sp. NPDC086554]|uniref:GNAT family N-acetyltransferase n=1 Tax=Streptomyces sp. NPDC086554 TaxID=3154864 RepID=UPI00343EB844